MFQKKIRLLNWIHLLIGLPAIGLSPAVALQLTSPDGQLEMEVSLSDLGGLADFPDGERMYYRIAQQGNEVVQWSPMGIRLEKADGGFIDLLDGLEMVETSTALGQVESFDVPHGKQRFVSATCNELRIGVAGGSGEEMDLVIRAFNDGMAYRYELKGEGIVTLEREYSGFKLPFRTLGYLQMKDFPYDIYAPNYQDPIVKALAGTSSPGNGYVLPGLFVLPDTSTWVLFHEAGLTKDYYGAHLDEPTPSRLYTIALPDPGEGNGIGPVEPTAELPFNTPWRILVIGDLQTVTETNLIRVLAEPYDEGRFGPADWIRPGKSAWSWWSQDIGTPALQREYIDFAHEFGWEYVLVDSDWVAWENEEQEIQDLVAYAGARNVKLNLWYNSGGPHNRIPLGGAEPRDRMQDPLIRQAEMDKLVQWGIAGIKVDYFLSDKQDRIQQYLGILEDALERKLLVNFHGSTVPRGWSRTYPNLMTMEAVTGAENYKWRAEPEALQNVRYTFTRNVVGPMDYTPLTFESALQRVGITYAHQLALSVVFESGIQHFADRADSSTTSGFRKLFAAEPEVASFLTDLPVAWDETRLLDGHPDSHSVIARRRGSTWYVGGINGLPVSFATSVRLSELVERPVHVEFFVRGSFNADLAYSQSLHESTDLLEFTMAPRDGFTLRISLVPLNYAEWIARITELPDEQAWDFDIDQDGLVNLLEFVFDHDPLVPDASMSHLPKVIAQNGQFFLRFKIRPEILPGDLYIEEASSPQFSNPSRIELSDTISGENGWHWLPLESPGSRFYRMVVRP